MPDVEVDQGFPVRCLFSTASGVNKRTLFQVFRFSSNLLFPNQNGCPEEGQEDSGVHQLEARPRHEVRQVQVGLQEDPRDSPTGKGQVGHHRQQHSPAQVKAPRQPSLCH